MMDYKEYLESEEYKEMTRRIEEEAKIKEQERAIEYSKKVAEEIEKRKQAAQQIPVEKRPGYVIDKQIAEARARGEITSPFIREHLKAKITAARWALALSMAMTLLFKGQWMLWIVFIITYICSVKRFKKDALKADERWGQRK